MAIRYAVAAGSIDDPTRWDGGTLPDPGDDVYLNGFAMTAPSGGSDINWALLSNAALGSPVINAGGTLTISAARNFVITAMVPRTDAGITNGMIQITAATGTVSITGEARAGGSGSTSFCINRTGNCNFVFNGTVTPITGAAASVISITGSGTVTMGSAGTPITLPTATTHLITINNASIVANIWADKFQGGVGGQALILTAFATANTFGPCYGGPSSGRFGISSNSATGTHTHVGDCYAGSGGSSPAGISKSGASTLIVNGKLISNPSFGISNAVITTGGPFILNGDGTSRDIELGPSTPLNIGSGTTAYTLNIANIVRVTQSGVHAISIGGTATGSTTVDNPIVGGSVGSTSAAIQYSAIGNNTLTAPSISGGAAASAPGVLCTMTGGQLVINSDAAGADFSAANGILVSGIGGNVTLNGKSTGNGYGVGSAIVGPAAGVAVTALSTVSVREVVSGPRGQSGIIGPVLMLPSPLNKSTYRRAVNGATTELVPAGGGGIQSYGFMS